MHTSSTQSLLLQNKEISYQAIRQADFPAEITETEKQTLQFCHEWLTGNSTFTLHTSGSTGTPKSITLTRWQMEQSARMTGKALGLQSGDKALVNLNTAYIGGLMMLVRGFVLDLQLTIVPPASMPLVSLADTTHFDFLSFVPMQMEAILQQAPHKKAIFNRAKAILLGGAAITNVLEEQLQPINAPVYHTYGMTETISHIALRLLNTHQKQAYFTVLEGVKISTDERGCLLIDTPVLDENPVITNDVAEILSPTTFIWKGRIDNVINSGGIKIQAEKIEKAVEQGFGQLQIQRRFFVAGLPDPRLGEAVTLFIEGLPLDKMQEMQLQQKITDSLSKYEKPKSICYVKVFQETATGKIDKKQSVRHFL